MEPKNIHIEPNKFGSNYHVFLLFIPAIVFVFLMVLIVTSSKSNSIAKTETDPVLGTSNSSK